jgi:hypothetical protein
MLVGLHLELLYSVNGKVSIAEAETGKEKKWILGEGSARRSEQIVICSAKAELKRSLPVSTLGPEP